MILTITNNQLLIESPWIDAFVASTGSFLIEYTHNCGEVITISPTLEDINDDDQFVLSIEDGVYLVTLINDTTSTLLKQTRCVSYITDETRCKMITKVEEQCDSKLVEKYIALQLVNDCTECDCTKACKIFESFIKDLNNECNC